MGKGRDRQLVIGNVPLAAEVTQWTYHMDGSDDIYLLVG